MAGSPPKPSPPTSAAGSSSPKPLPTLAAGSSSSMPPPPNCFPHWPQDEELIVSYLRPRVLSHTKADFIHEVDLYTADPDQLTKNHTAASSTRSRLTSAWFFFTPLHRQGSTRIKRNVDSGRKGTWVGVGPPKDVLSDDKVIGKRRGFTFEEKVGGNHVKTAWRMTELRLNPNPNEGGQDAGSSDLLALCMVYRSLSIWIAKAEGESSTAVAKADAEAPAAAAVVTPGPKGADEEIGADTAAGHGRKRKAGDEDSGAEPVASSPGRQNRPGGESADAAKTGEIFADSRDALDAAKKAAADSGAETVASSAGRQNKADGEIESADATTTSRDYRIYNFFDGSRSAPLDAPEEAEQEPRDPQFYDFLSDSQNPKKQ